MKLAMSKARRKKLLISNDRYELVQRGQEIFAAFRDVVELVNFLTIFLHHFGKHRSSHTDFVRHHWYPMPPN